MTEKRTLDELAKKIKLYEQALTVLREADALNKDTSYAESVSLLEKQIAKTKGKVTPAADDKKDSSEE